MNEILGYGEDAFTLWALKKRISWILEKLNDSSTPSDCLVFFRPSFGRSGGKGSAQFGEFDSILASSKNVYLIESKWDNFSENESDEVVLDGEQVLRHKIFSWYYVNWDIRQYPEWEKFVDALQGDFVRNFPDKKIAPPESLLAQNLEFVLRKLKDHFKDPSYAYKTPENILVYFYDGNKSKGIEKVISGDVIFKVINIDYSQYVSGNFIRLD